ncbi:MAG TPA: hypothetical protein EYH05_19210 [Anaerolineae bacterium]|nr:hypothetical protein [Anaerolineae bacterium]
MKNIAWKFLFITVLTLVIFSYAPSGQAAPAQQANLLNNADFEWPYDSDGSASGWGRWFRNSSEDMFDDCTKGYRKRPNWSQETNPALIKSGGSSQHVGNMWDTWSAGVQQNVAVNPGSTYRFTVWVYTFASNNDFPGPSEGGLQSNVKVGIDPNGSGLWNDADVVWSGTINPMDNWQQISVEATATGNQITVFTSANYGVPGVNQCRKHLDFWADAASLVEVGPPPTNTPVPLPTSPPPPPVTNTPIPPTPTWTPEVPPTATAVPPTETPIPPTGGTICVNAFADENANGIKDDNEGYMGNVTFTVAQGTQIIGQAISTGTETPACFAGLEPGDYQVAQTVPGRLEMTTAGNTTVAVQPDQIVGVEFGSRIRPDDTGGNPGENPGDGPDGSATPVPGDGEGDTGGSDSGPNLLAISGILLLGVGALLLVGIGLIALGRRN